MAFSVCLTSQDAYSDDKYLFTLPKRLNFGKNGGNWSCRVVEMTFDALWNNVKDGGFSYTTKHSSQMKRVIIPHGVYRRSTDLIRAMEHAFETESERREFNFTEIGDDQLSIYSQLGAELHFYKDLRAILGDVERVNENSEQTCQFSPFWNRTAILLEAPYLIESSIINERYAPILAFIHCSDVEQTVHYFPPFDDFKKVTVDSISTLVIRLRGIGEALKFEKTRLNLHIRFKENA